MSKHNPASRVEIDQLRNLTTTSYAFCDHTLNKLREIVKVRHELKLWMKLKEIIYVLIIKN